MIEIHHNVHTHRPYTGAKLLQITMYNNNNNNNTITTTNNNISLVYIARHYNTSRQNVMFFSCVQAKYSINNDNQHCSLFTNTLNNKRIAFTEMKYDMQSFF